MGNRLDVRHTRRVLAEVEAERHSVTLPADSFIGPYPSDGARLLRDGEDLGTREHALRAALGQALAQREPAALRKALVQVASVAVAWAEHLDREGRR